MNEDKPTLAYWDRNSREHRMLCNCPETPIWIQAILMEKNIKRNDIKFDEMTLRKYEGE